MIDFNDEIENNRLPKNFIYTDEGIYRNISDHKKWICSPLKILALARDVNSENWSKLLEFKDADNKIHTWVMPMEILRGNGEEVCSELLRQGLQIASGSDSRKYLIEFILESKPTKRALCVSRIGWHEHNFVLPNKTFGNNKEPVIFQSPQMNKDFITSGTLEEWKNNIGKLCVGNSRLILAVSAAFASPLLYLIRSESGGIHFVGESSSGKTTVLKIATSVFGSPKYLNCWRGTANGLEGLAVSRCDTLLTLDEISQISAWEAGEIAYMLANGAGKIRARKTGTARPAEEWRLIYISAGETSLAQCIQETGRSSKPGQEVRQVDVPANTLYGVFEDLHNCESGSEFSNLLTSNTACYYGTPAQAFLEIITDTNLQKNLIEKLKANIDIFKHINLPKNAGGQATRICDRFALIAAAGELASEFNITGWEKETAMKAASVCFQDCLNYRGGSQNLEEQRICFQVKDFFGKYSENRFALLKSKAPQYDIPDLAGYKKTDGDNTLYYVYQHTFHKEICSGLDSRLATKILVRKGWLKPDSAGSPTNPVRLPEKTSKIRCFVFSSKALEEGVC
jgi:putative DNA primase/helicase